MNKKSTCITHMGKSVTYHRQEAIIAREKMSREYEKRVLLKHNTNNNWQKKFMKRYKNECVLRERSSNNNETKFAPTWKAKIQNILCCQGCREIVPLMNFYWESKLITISSELTW